MTIQATDVSRIIRKARRSRGLTLSWVARRSGVALATVHRYESAPNEAMARVLSVLDVLGFEIRPKGQEIRLQLVQAMALRRLLRAIRSESGNGHLPLGVVLAMEAIVSSGAARALVSRANLRGAPTTIAASENLAENRDLLRLGHRAPPNSDTVLRESKGNL